MTKKYVVTAMVLFGYLFLIFLTCASPSQSPEKPKLASIPDISVFASDTVRIFVEPVFAPAAIRGFVWSSDAGKTFPESTAANTVMKSWGVADTGIHRCAVKVIDNRGIVSDSIPFTVVVISCKPVLNLLGDSILDFHDPIVIRAVNASDCRRKLTYAWSFDGGASFSDTTHDSTLRRQLTIADTGKIFPVVCRASVLPGLVSPDARINIQVRFCRPVISVSGASAIHAGDSTRFTISQAIPCQTAYFLWSFNNGVSYTDTTFSPSIVKRWRIQDTALTRVVAAASTPDGILSAPEILLVSATACLPVIRLTADSFAVTGDSTRFSVAAPASCSPVLWYLWSFNGGISYTDTVRLAGFTKIWNSSDIGEHFVYVKAQMINGGISKPDSCKIVIRAIASNVSLPADTAITAGDTLIVTARIDSGNHGVGYYTWSVDHGAIETITSGNTFRFISSPDKAGAHVLTVRTIANNGGASLSDSMAVTVRIIYPALALPRDTLLKRKDTLLATVNASSAGGSITRYLWNIGSYSWTDSSAAAQKKIWYQGKDTITVVVGARDSRGVTKIDSFHVYFNAPPTDLRMLAPRPGDTVIFRNLDSTFKRGAISFRFSATDKNGPRDSLTYTLMLGNSASALSKVYEGRDSSWTNSTPLDTANYFWTITVKDRMGDSSRISGEFTCLLQKSICFAGHSIMVGFGDTTNGNGGVRGRMLPVMRARRGGAVKVRPIGPLTTGFMANKNDDSCFAVASYRARDLYLLLKNSFPALNADMWVVMLGVNDAYSNNNEFRQLLWIIDTIHARNPMSYTYVINGLPNTGSYGQDKVFNGWLADSIKARKAAHSSWNIWNINAFNKFTLADSTSPNPALFYPETPLLHPNSAGYDTLSKMLLDTMNLKLP